MLHLGGSLLAELPLEVGHLEKLEVLDASRTPMHELPSTIGHLVGLRHLNLEWTRLETLPVDLGALTSWRLQI